MGSGAGNIMSGVRRGKDAAAIAGDLMLAPMVVAMRLPMMAAESQTFAPWSGESMKAVTEKYTALSEGVAAAQLSYFQSMVSFWPELMSGRTPSLLSGAAAERSVNAALEPASRKVKANFRRLSRKS